MTVRYRTDARPPVERREPMTVADLRRVLDRHPVDRVVVVQNPASGRLQSPEPITYGPRHDQLNPEAEVDAAHFGETVLRLA